MMEAYLELFHGCNFSVWTLNFLDRTVHNTGGALVYQNWGSIP